MGYSHIHNFGNISEFINYSDKEYSNFLNRLESQINGYLYEIPENITYSILPILRWQHKTGEHSSISITNSIKITRDTSRKLLTKRIINNIHETLLIYLLHGLDLELYIMGRPWLSFDDFNIDKLGLAKIFDEQIERELASLSDLSLDKISYKKNF